MKNASDFQFTTHKKLNNNIQKYWEEIKDFKLTWIPEWDMWYEIVVEVDEKDDNTKTVQGTTLGEAELSQIMLYGIEINTETDIARDDYEIPTTFYNPDHSEASLMNRLLDEKAPHYTIKHIDKSLMNLQRTFTFDDISLYDAFQEISEELDCLFVFGCGSDENGKPERTISVYDLEANCLDCGNRDTFVHKCPKCGSENIQLGYGQYTNVFISKDNLADEITYSVDTDSVKNCFKLEAGDDLMTAAIRSCNPNGTDYIYYFPDETRTEMSQELQDKLKTYDTLYEEYQSTHEFNLDASFVANYNALVKKYEQYDEDLKNTEIKNPIVGYPKLMRIYFDTIDMVQFLRNKLMPPIDKPDNDAQSQGEYLIANLPSSASTTSLKNLSVSTADNIMVMLAQSIVKGSFKTTVTETTLSNNVWRGKFNLQNYSDEDDKFTSQFVSIGINENYESYVKQRIDTILNRADNDFYDIVGLFKQDMDVFKSQLKKYCLNSLQIFQKCCQSAIDLMVQQGVSSNSDSSIYGINTKVLYENVYVPYYNKMNAIQDEIKVREDEVYTIEGKYNNQNELVQDGVQIEIERLVGEVQDALNFKNYIGINLYKEFSSFIRMDKYSNENYISDGLNNTELMQNAIEFISVATKELFKSATLQHSITGTIKNFLRMKEFEPVTNNFKNGNWICVGIDDKVYQLRIIEYEIDFSDTQNISVTFSDVFTLPDGTSYYERLEEVTNKMATSYSGVVRQSTINTNFKNKMNEMITKGLSMTNTKIVSNADNQDITWDEHGLLCREYDDILSDYTDSQLKIINHGIYITDDNWRTARAGIGNFIYYDPKDKTYKESYGVIADTLVSNLILTSEVGIYNEEKSIEMAKDGIIVTTNTMNKNVFTIRKEITDDEGNVTYERQLYIDDNGNIVLGGNASISWDNVTGTDNVVVKDDLSSVVTGLENAFSEKINYLEQQDDLKAETWYQANDPSTSWDTDKLKLIHKGDIWYNTNTQQTLIYNGSEWELTKTTPPDSVFDKIDGKAQIFISTPKPPYNTGDLWFNSTTSDIMTCVKSRTSGSYVASDWEKRNKYTDDSFAKKVQENLNNLQIGGRNLARKTSSDWSDWFVPVANKDNSCGLFAVIYPSTSKSKGDIFTVSFDIDLKKFTQGTGGTFNLYLQGSVDDVWTVSNPFTNYNFKDKALKGDYTEHVTYACQFASDSQVSATKFEFGFRCNYSNGTGKFRIRNLKIEKGNKATDWTPAPEDTETYADNLAADLKTQIDGKIETFSQTTDPSASWTSTQKVSHKGDIWYNSSTKETKRYNGNTWDTLQNKEAQEASSLAQKKAQVFTGTPTIPYYKGDLWFGGTGSDIKTCTVTRTSGNYTASDWAKYNKYTDDTTANNVKTDLNNLSQVLGYNGTKITGTYIYSPHIIGGELSIGDASGVHASISTAGKLTATGAEITGTIYATNGVFSGSLNAATGTFTGTLSGANGTFTGKLSGATGSFTGSVVATSITAKQSYSIYYNDVGTGEPTDSVQVITAFDWGTNTTQIGFGLIDSSLDSSKMHGMLLIKEQGTRILTLIADDINTNGWLNVSKLNITDSLGQYKGVPYKSIMWNPTDTFDFNGYNHHHTILPYKNGNFAVGMESTTTEMLTISLLPYTLTTNTNADGYGNITVEKNKDTKSQISIGAAKYPFACIYVDAIYLTGDKKTYTSLANLGDGGTTNYNGLTNKPKINNVTLASGNNTLADLGIASSGHTHSKLSNSNPVDYKGFGHCHTVIMNSNHNMWIAINNDNVPALTPYKLKDSTTYINVDTYTLDKGGTCNLGSTSAPWNAVYAKNYYDENGKAISMGSGITGGLTIKLNGTSKITSWKGTSDVIVDITASSIGALTSNDISSYATQNWVKGAFGDTLSISGNTLYLKNYNGGQLSYVTLPTSFSGTSDRIVDSSGYCIIADYYSGGRTHRIIPSTGSSYIADTILLGTDSYYFRNVYSKSFTNKSDYYAKEDFHTYSFNIEKAYMNIIPVSFKYKNFSTTDHHDRVHYGFIAQNIEKVFNENGISNTQLGMIKIEESKELNTYGRYKSYGLDYTEFISLNTHMTQKAHHRIDLVEEENQKLKNTILSLQGEISIIKQKLEELAC